jgi:cell division inhibitor SulA/protein ImuA
VRSTTDDAPEGIPAIAPQIAPVPSLEHLLAHPAIWRGRSVARSATFGTGCRRLDAALPGGGWPAAGLTEILTARSGLGELRLLIPLLVRLGCQMPPRCATWVSPPFEPYAPALTAAGVPLERQLVVRTADPAWVIEQALDSGGCAIALAWFGPRVAATVTALRRLQLAAQRSTAPVFLFRPLAEATRASPAELRLSFAPSPGGGRLQLLKSRGGARQPLELRWQEWGDHGAA